MREILFRGKRTDNGEWVAGKYLDQNHLGTFYYDTECQDYDITVCPVIPESVGKITGITDKNGTEICDGDIVKIADFQIGQVVFECGAFGIAVMPYIDWDYLDSEIAEYTGCDNRPHFCRNDNFISLWEIMWNYNQEENNCYVVEVIGNIHDNPELLKGIKK